MHQSPDDAPILTEKERAAAMSPPMTVEEFRAMRHPFQEAADARAAANAEYRAKRAAELDAKRARSPTALCESLAPDASVLFAQYSMCSQISGILQTISRRSGIRFKSCVERSLVDDSVLGVRVTRVA